MLQKNRMGNRQHRCIWVTNMALQQKNRRTGITRSTITGYTILVFTESKQKHILTKSHETLERAAYLFILLWLLPTAVELKPKGLNSCWVSDAVWLEGRSPMLCQGFCSSCRFAFIASLKYLLKRSWWAKENCFKTLGCKSLLILQNPVLMLPSETAHRISLSPFSSLRTTWNHKTTSSSSAQLEVFFRYTTRTPAKSPQTLPVWLSSCSFVFLSLVRRT